MQAEQINEAFQLTRQEWVRVTRALLKLQADVLTPAASRAVANFIDYAEEDFDRVAAMAVEASAGGARPDPAAVS